MLTSVTASLKQMYFWVPELFVRDMPSSGEKDTNEASGREERQRNEYGIMGVSNCLLLVKPIHLSWILCSQLLLEPFSVKAEVGVGQLLQIQFSECWKKSKPMGGQQTAMERAVAAGIGTQEALCKLWKTCKPLPLKCTQSLPSEMGNQTHCFSLC